MSSTSPILPHQIIDLAMNLRVQEQKAPQRDLSCFIRSLDPAEKKHFDFQARKGFSGFWSRIGWAIAQTFRRAFGSTKYDLKTQLQMFAKRTKGVDITDGIIKSYSDQNNRSPREVYEALRSFGVLLKNCEDKLMRSKKDQATAGVKSELQPVDVLIEKTHSLCEGFFTTAFQDKSLCIDENTGALQIKGAELFAEPQNIESFFEKEHVKTEDESRVLVAMCDRVSNRKVVAAWIRKKLENVSDKKTYVVQADTIEKEFLACQRARQEPFLLELRKIFQEVKQECGLQRLRAERDENWPGYTATFAYDEEKKKFGFYYSERQKEEEENRFPLGEVADEIVENLAPKGDARVAGLKGLVLSELVGDEEARKELAHDASKKILHAYHEQNEKILPVPSTGIKAALKKFFFSGDKKDREGVIASIRKKFEEIDKSYSAQIEQVSTLLTGDGLTLFTKEEADRLINDINAEKVAAHEKLMKLESEEMKIAYFLYHLDGMQKKVTDITGALADFRVIPGVKAGAIIVLLSEFRRAASSIQEKAKEDKEVQTAAKEVIDGCDAAIAAIEKRVPEEKVGSGGPKSVQVTARDIIVKDSPGAVVQVGVVAEKISIKTKPHVAAAASRANDIFNGTVGQAGSLMTQLLGNVVGQGCAGALQGFMMGGVPGMVSMGIGSAVASIATTLVPKIGAAFGLSPWLNMALTSAASLGLSYYTASSIRLYLGATVVPVTKALAEKPKEQPSGPTTSSPLKETTASTPVPPPTVVQPLVPSVGKFTSTGTSLEVIQPSVSGEVIEPPVATSVNTPVATSVEPVVVEEKSSVPTGPSVVQQPPTPVQVSEAHAEESYSLDEFTQKVGSVANNALTAYKWSYVIGPAVSQVVNILGTVGTFFVMKNLQSSNYRSKEVF